MHLAIVIDPSEKSIQSGETLDHIKFEDNECIKQNVFINDEKVVDGWYNRKAWVNSVQGWGPHLTKICLGTCSMSYQYTWYNCCMECYSLRFYNRALKDDEVHENYEKTIEYHRILEGQNKKKVQQ